MSGIISLSAPKEQIYTYNQLYSTYKTVEEIIDNLDDYAIQELFCGNEKDVDTLLNIIIEETNRAIHTNSGKIKNSSFGYLDKLTENLDSALKKLVYNYFVITCLYDFEVNWHHIEWGNLIQMYKWLCILAARDHSKSFTFSKAYPLWKLYRYEKNIGINSKLNRELNFKKGMIITSEFSLGKDFLSLIKEEIDTNDILKEKLSPVMKENWGATEIHCKNGAELQVKSYESRLRGRHPGWIVVDDMLDDSVLYSSDQRTKYTEFFHSTIMNLIVPGGQVITVGTPFHEKDLYMDLKSKPGWKVFEYPAIWPDGSLLWENRYNLNALLEKRESQGSIIFSREILCKPISSESTIFPYHIVSKSFIGMDNFVLAKNYHSCPKKFAKIAVGCDFAISSEIGSDYTVFMVIGIDDLNNFWLLYMYRERGASYNKQIAMLKEIKSNFEPSIIYAESNAFQKVMIDIANDSNLGVIPHNTGVNKYDLKSGLPGLAVLFEQNRIRFPRGDAYSRDITDIIVSELTSITWSDSKKIESVSEHDDTAYALWLAIKGIHYVNDSFSFDFI